MLCQASIEPLSILPHCHHAFLTLLPFNIIWCRCQVCLPLTALCMPLEIWNKPCTSIHWWWAKPWMQYTCCTPSWTQQHPHKMSSYSNDLSQPHVPHKQHQQNSSSFLISSTCNGKTFVSMAPMSSLNFWNMPNINWCRLSLMMPLVYHWNINTLSNAPNPKFFGNGVNELGCLAQGVLDLTGTDTIRFTPKHQILSGWADCCGLLASKNGRTLNLINSGQWPH